MLQHDLVILQGLARRYNHILTCLMHTHFQPSRPSKKVHNFGKRSNSIRRNPGAPVIRSTWLYKQVSAFNKKPAPAAALEIHAASLV